MYNVVDDRRRIRCLDELLTKTTPKVGANGTGWLATHKSPAEIIGVMVREKIAEMSGER
ncbi:MAG: hypothetical protein LBC75_04185 [Fibromonadaceae bacterium]|nr:hypothetical protein [Fibromonadaceae bacterium]